MPYFAGAVCVVSAAMCSGVFLVVFRFLYLLLVRCLCFFAFLCLLLFLRCFCLCFLCSVLGVILS